MSSILIKNGTVIPLGGDARILSAHSISIIDDKIEKIGPASAFLEKDFDTVIDANGHLVMPGFINTHMHFYSSFAKGLNKAEPSKNFQEVLKNLWWRLDKKLSLDDCYYSALVASIEAIKKGTTTIIDHHASPGAVSGSLDRIADAVLESGLRASLCYEFSDRDGEKIANDGIEENIRFIERCANEKNDLLRAHFGVHASFTVGDKTMAKAVELAKNYQTGFHIHCAEDLSDQELTVKKHGKRVVKRLYDLGILGPLSICAHAVHLDQEEMELLAKTETSVVHNPQSNMNNAVGVADLSGLLAKGITVGLGTDAMTLNMLEELRSALWINKLSKKDPGGFFMECVNSLIQGNPKIANRFWNGLGELKAGNPADVVIIDYIPTTEMTDENFAGHLVFGISQAVVQTTICNGKLLMKDRKLICLDEQEIFAKSRELSARLWNRF